MVRPRRARWKDLDPTGLTPLELRRRLAGLRGDLKQSRAEVNELRPTVKRYELLQRRVKELTRLIVRAENARAEPELTAEGERVLRGQYPEDGDG